MDKKKLYLDKINFDTLAMLPMLSSITDKDKKYSWACRDVVKLIGYQSLDQVVGITDFEINTPAVEFAHDFVKQNDNVINSQQTHHFFCCCYYQNEGPTLLNTLKAPLFDSNDNPEAVLILANPIQNNHLEKFVHYSVNSSSTEKKYSKKQYWFELSDTFQGEIPLSERQIEVLFFLIRGKTLGDIASILTISKRTVEDYVSVLKDKFLCINKSQLIEKAFHLGYWTVVPTRFAAESMIGLI